MPSGIPNSKGFNDIAPLDVTRLTNVPLVKAAAFRANQKRKDDKTGREYEVEQVKLSLDFDTGHIMRDTDGNPVLTESGEEQPHYINEGFTTLSGNPRAKLVMILKALGFNTKEFIEQQGRGKGGLSSEAAESLEVVFGEDGLGNNFRGSEWGDLPLYTPGQDARKRQVEVKIESLKILGREVLGRWLDMAITIDDKGFNRVDTFMVSEKPASLDQEAPPAKAMPQQVRKETHKPLGDEDATQDTPLDPAPEAKADPDPEVKTKGQAYVLKHLKAENVPPSFYVRVAQLISGFDDFATLNEMSTPAAKNFKSMIEASSTAIKEATEMAMEGPSTDDDDIPFDEDEDEDF